MYKETTHGITVTAMPVYIDERSEPEKDQHFWAYRICIRNDSAQTVKLISKLNIEDSELFLIVSQ